MTEPREVYLMDIKPFQGELYAEVIALLQYHVGKEKAIGKGELLYSLRRNGHGKGVQPSTFERQVRRAITTARKAGVLICSSAGDGGYYMASDLSELDEFCAIELDAKIVDMSETVKALRAAGMREFGYVQQRGLF